jgi:TolB-like protein
MKEQARFDARRVERAAAEWLVKHEAGPLAAADETAFRAWLAERPEHEAVFARCEASMFLAGKLREDPELAWAFDDAARVAQGAAIAAPARALRDWLASPVLAWSVTAMAVAVAALAVVYRPAPVGKVGTPAPFAPEVSAAALRVVPDDGLPQTAVELPGQVVVDARSVAVLPFAIDRATRRRGDAASFAASLHGQIVTRLAAVPGFYVAEPRSVQPYTDSGLAPRDIAVQLGVRGVVQARVELEQDNVHVNLQLTDAANDSLLLEDAYDRTVADVASIESDIAADIAYALADPSRIARLER